MALDSNRYVKGNVKKSGASPPMLHAGRFPCFSLIWSPTTWSHGGCTGAGGIFFPAVLSVAVNVVSLGEFLAPWLLTGLPGLQWQAWINGDLVGLALIACQEGFFLQVQVWCGPTLMQNMVVAAPLLNGTLYFDMDAITDTSLVRVTIYIPGGNTLTSSRVLTVTCLRALSETCALGELRSRFSDFREVSFRVTPVHPVVTWHAPVLPLNKGKMILIHGDVVLQLDAVVVLRLHLPPYCGEWGRGHLLPSQTS